MTIKTKANNPIGVFDSGLGGLTVVKALIRQLPHEDIVYFGDTARVPYGTKSKESIIRFSKENVRVLAKYKVKVIVVACNSSSSFALGALRKQFRGPVMGVIEPGAKAALDSSSLKRVGVIATSATVNSGSYRKKLKSLAGRVKVVEQACPLFVPLVEEGRLNTQATELIAREYLKEVKRAGVDSLILGCTHYPLLKAVIRKVMGRRVSLIDSAQAVAAAVERKLSAEGLNASRQRKGHLKCLISDQPQQFRSIAKRFLGFEMKNVVRCKNV